MEGTGKSPNSDFSGDFAREILTLLAVPDDENGGEWLSDVPVKEELVEEVMQELLKEINPTPLSQENFPMPFSSFDAVGGNQGSCGPSFSDSESSLMAGIEGHVAGTGGGGGLPCFVGPTVGLQAAAAGDGCPVAEGGGGLGEKKDGCDGKEGDDEWLTRVLSLVPQEIDEWI